MPQRKLDVVLDSVKRLMRMGATANLVNLLQKQHPADLAQLFSDLPDKERQSAFTLLAERNTKLAMEALSELGPEAGAALLARSVGRRDRQADAGAAVRRRGGPDRLPARGARRPPSWSCYRSGPPAATSATCSSTPSRPPAAS